MDGATVAMAAWRWPRELGAYIVGSLVERDAMARCLYLTALLAGPDGMAGRYRMLHPSRAERAWADAGRPGAARLRSPGRTRGPAAGPRRAAARAGAYPGAGRRRRHLRARAHCASRSLRGLPATAVPFADPRVRAANPRHFHLWRQRASENNTFVAFANRAAPLGMGESGVFGPEPNGDEALVAGGACGIAVLDVETRSLSERYATVPVRAKELLRKRVPAMYAPLVAPRTL